MRSGACELSALARARFFLGHRMNRETKSQSLQERVRALLPRERTREQRMLGGVAFLLNGNTLCCVSKKGLMLRVGKNAEEAALSRPHAAPCMGTGRRMAGFILVQPAGIESDVEVRSWLRVARSYVESLPAKLRRMPSASPSWTRGRKTKLRLSSSSSSCEKGET
jgi:hypothetical protein